MKVDMEAKLQAWLESKGKTISTQRIYSSPFHGRTPCSVKPLRKPSIETKAVENSKCALDIKERSRCKAGRNLFRSGVYTDSKEEVQNLAASENNQGKLAVPVADASKSYPALPDELQSSEKDVTESNHFNASFLSPVNEIKIEALQKPHREVLSPIPSNIERSNFVSSDPKTPNLRAAAPCNGENSINEYGTPLAIITARSSSLKTSLLQDYIEFLNTANREELMELKGIGQKMADYIIELRETSPLKSLGDLEKTGLSSKQVHNMFGRASRGLLENLVHNA